ncbi:lipocalin family protein [Fodinibius salsisoli]|uniref:Lipocalin family protein n=1 Tax=Fodinibius salsisoli TaxID=2820877 RepID=A0ABT3PML9_9BACT|nr:lipocalin family protein [Fodinibius salsisoli]MCW9707191.1 lipocalin family protein [Fodinibius salsisoli]
MQIFYATSRGIIAALFLIFSTFNCSDTSTEPDPNLSELSEKEQKMAGTWKHVRTEGEGLGAGPVDFGTFTWTFNADRTGEYYQNPDSDTERRRDITWRLDGDDLIFSKEGGDPTYRVEEYGENEMRWYNYTLAETNDSYANIYVVERQ